MQSLDLQKYFPMLETCVNTKVLGKVLKIQGVLISAKLPQCQLGNVWKVDTQGSQPILAEVVGFEQDTAYLMSYSNLFGINSGSTLELIAKSPQIQVSHGLLGRVIDGEGNPLDGKGPILNHTTASLYGDKINPLDRASIDKVMSVGVKALDGFITAGVGQRLSLMAGSGVGKSMLLGMIAKNSSSDINVIALIGERGREAKEFVEQTLDAESLKKSVVVVVTSDQSPVTRVRGAYLATAIARYFSSKNNDVLLMMDSITRFAMAQREIGLSVGEPPTSKGYTPSVFTHLPKLLEQAGNFENSGSITGLYTVLVEGDDMNDPIADSVRSIVDGHIVLTRDLAERGHYPAIDVLKSASRLLPQICDQEHQSNALSLRKALATYQEAQDLINIGAYQMGANPDIDRAITLIKPINEFLQQHYQESFNYDYCRIEMSKLLRES